MNYLDIYEKVPFEDLVKNYSLEKGIILDFRLKSYLVAKITEINCSSILADDSIENLEVEDLIEIIRFATNNENNPAKHIARFIIGFLYAIKNFNTKEETYELLKEYMLVVRSKNEKQENNALNNIVEIYKEKTIGDGEKFNLRLLQ